MVLTVAGLSIPTESTSAGLLLANTNPYLESLVWFINIAVTEEIPHLRERLENREDLIFQELFAKYAKPDRDLTAGANRWLALTGNELGTDVYVIGIGFSEYSTYIPRPVLLELLDLVLKLRETSSVVDPSQGQNQSTADVTDETASDSLTESLMRDLEERARMLDDLVKQPPSPELGAIESAKRRVLLIELDNAGFFNPTQVARLHNQLELWNLPTLQSYYHATIELHAYYNSPERQQLISTPQPESILKGPISVDWFRRLNHTPIGYTPFDWLSQCEQIFENRQVNSGGAGEIFTRINRKLTLLVWRVDDGIYPKLLRAEIVDD